MSRCGSHPASQPRTARPGFTTANVASSVDLSCDALRSTFVELRVGCPMWAHKPWQGRFLPEGLSRQEQLSTYATWCTAVEGNTTFYGLPSPATVASWADSAPAGFRFVFKLPRTITHERRLRHTETELHEFLTTIEPLGERATTLSVQLPGSFGPTDLGALDRFLAAAPRTHRYGVEVRHPRFFDHDGPRRSLERLLASHDAEWISFDTSVLFSAPPSSEMERDGWEKKPRLPVRTTALTEQPVVRYVGRDDVEATVAGWQRWLPVVVDWVREGRRPTFFLHTPDNDEALGLARRFHDEVRALVPELDPLPEPIEATPTTLF
jgi:uncharacterized protein YecE (DUF72 family)